MKKIFKTMLALMASAMTFTGCTSDILENTPEQIPSALKPMTFTATQEGQGNATRAAIVGTAINWTEGDKISIFDGATENNGNQQFTLTVGEGTTSGTFEGKAAEVSTYYALYPYSDSKFESKIPTLAEAEAAAGDGSSSLDFWKSQIHDEGYVLSEMEMYGISPENQAFILAYLKNQPTPPEYKGVVLPTEQAVGEGQFVDPKAMLMIGTSDDTNNIQFKNVCAYVKVKPTFDCTSIILCSNGMEDLAGTLTVGFDTDDNPTTTVTANATYKVTLNGNITADNTYYIAVRPGILANGFTIIFKTTDGKYKKSAKKSVTFTRSQVLNLGELEISDLTPAPTTGTATRTSDINVNWVQLWENGPKFAEYNVGATSATGYGGYYCWGGSTDQDKNGVHYEGDVLGDNDTAILLWGSNWRMPTQAELQTLLKYCEAAWTDNYNGTGIKGRVFTGKDAYSSNSIFLPAAGNYDPYGLGGQGNSGSYWSSTPYGNDDAYYLNIGEAYQIVYGSDRGFYGYSVRAVLEEGKEPAAPKTYNVGDIVSCSGHDGIVVDLGGTLGKVAVATMNVGATSVNDARCSDFYLTYANACAAWSGWRLPTLEEFEALCLPGSKGICGNTQVGEHYVPMMMWDLNNNGEIDLYLPLYDNDEDADNNPYDKYWTGTPGNDDTQYYFAPEIEFDGEYAPTGYYDREEADVNDTYLVRLFHDLP